ncbi:MAG: YafY family protein [Anaerorhabdus sp.]|uniref:helix-turn-helix transcriptional regulator n=1 Tax=Anaerorhabdus sp. TaxID=1872524 RepID=UPI002B21AECD|nr:YafY family protein [Anaerorhabdus sp.]MEA4875604.1 YafY family protein [Anaerorhabdus sp.]
MSTERLFKIINRLMDEKKVSAKDLAEDFEVSVRTIYRDIDALTLAGIPVYATQGKGGGISLMEGYVLNKTLLSSSEQDKILMALENIQVTSNQVDDLILKLKSLFQKGGKDWIQVDLGGWGMDKEETQKFDILREAILSKRYIKLNYYDAVSNLTERIVKPARLVFKGKSWYLQAYCELKQDYRTFKLFRIQKAIMLDEQFEENLIPPEIESDTFCALKEITFKAGKGQRIRIYEEFHRDDIEEYEEYMLVKTKLPVDQWLLGYILSFGGGIEVIEPKEVRDFIKIEIEKLNKIYK